MAAEAGEQGHGKPSGLPGIGKWVGVGVVALGLMAALAWAGTARFHSGPAADARAYLAGNGEKAGVVTTESGLQYQVLRPGNGPSPTADDLVLVHYEGRLINGEVFDSSYRNGQPAALRVNEVIPGWTEGLQLMKTGAKYRFTVPPRLGYGERGAGGVIPPNAVLVFDVELLAIAPKQG